MAASSAVNRLLAGLITLYNSSDDQGVLICRAFQLYHPDPLPTLAGYLFANLFKAYRTEDGEYPLEGIIQYVYEHVDMVTGKVIFDAIQPSHMQGDLFLLYHL
jgi:hypothetical protein